LLELAWLRLDSMEIGEIDHAEVDSLLGCWHPTTQRLRDPMTVG
jgi:hypothetical protein